MNETEKSPQPHSIEEIYNLFVNIVLKTRNFATAYTAAQKLNAENQAYFSQYSYKNPPPNDQEPPEQL